MYDVSNINMWKFKMSAYLKVLRLHVYFATTKSSYISNGKHIETNAQALVALRQSFSKDYLYMVSHCDSAFTVWNILTSPKEQTTNVLEKESIGDESDQACFMV